jgi:hypothetical protein
MVLAAEAHDNGWWDWDVYPSIDEQGLPIPFTRTPREFRSRFYGKGKDNVISRDLYAGLIVSMHGVGLTKKRYGTMPTMVERQDEYSQQFAAEREPKHSDMLESLRKTEQYAGVTPVILLPNSIAHWIALAIRNSRQLAQRSKRMAASWALASAALLKPAVLARGSTLASKSITPAKSCCIPVATQLAKVLPPR